MALPRARRRRLTPERWREVQELFDAVVELPAAARASRLEDACREDAELRREVESLLASSEKASGYLEHGALGELSGPRDGPEGGDETSPRRIGPYDVIGELGHGGMGTVYLGTRKERDFEKRVAIKVVRRGMDSELILRRFRSERQILSGLEHPYIARLYDGGSTEDGLPYFVLEHVEGETLLAFCDARRFATPERLRLFRKVCEAVQHAHAHLVVHRDLKPSNILVTADGTPKLLDFGIAKVLGPESGGGEETRTALRLMTPDYASPEQVRGERVTTASDVYSLGVILYALLTGHRPYRLASRSVEAIERAVCEAEPERPSTAVRRIEETPSESGGETVRITPESVGHARDASPARLRRSLSGDLDAIVLKALRKEPERRYGSVEQLSEDIGRHLEGLPVSARRGTASYRVGRFVRRNAAPLSAAAAVFALVAVLVAFYTVRLRRERDHARIEAEKATQIATFLSGIFEVSDPDRSKGEKLTARDLLDRAAARVDKELVGQPEIRASMLDLLGTVYRQLGSHPQSRDLFEKALALREHELGGGHPDVATSLMQLGVSFHVTGQYARALPLMQRALAIRERELGRDHEQVARALDAIANLQKATGHYAVARRLLERSLAIQERLAEPDPTLRGKTLNNLGLVLQRDGDLEGARLRFEHSLRLHERTSGAESAQALAPLSNLAEVLRAQGKSAEALPLQKRHLALAERIYGPDHPMLATSLNSLAGTYNDAGDYAAAVPLYERAIHLYETAFGPDHPDLAYPVKNLGNLYMAKGEFRVALPYYERALRIREKALGPDHTNTAQSLVNLGNAEERLGHLAAAERLFVRALDIDRRVLSAGNRNLCEPLLALGHYWSARGDCRRAEPLLAEAVAIRRKTLAAGHALITQAEEALKECHPTAGS